MQRIFHLHKKSCQSAPFTTMNTVDTIDAIECMGTIDSMDKVKKLQLEIFFVITIAQNR